MIFYEAPHKLQNTLKDLCAAFGTERRISLCRELTKLHEQILRMTLGEALAYYTENDPRGEYVLVLEGAPEPAGQALTLEDAVALALQRIESGASKRTRCAKSRAKRAFRKRALRGGLTGIKYPRSRNGRRGFLFVLLHRRSAELPVFSITDCG